MSRDDILVVKQGLRIPSDAMDYSDFVKKIAANEQIFKESLAPM